MKCLSQRYISHVTLDSQVSSSSFFGRPCWPVKYNDGPGRGRLCIHVQISAIRQLVPHPSMIAEFCDEHAHCSDQWMFTTRTTYECDKLTLQCCIVIEQSPCPRGPIYKSLSLYLDHKVRENFQGLRILLTVRYV